MDVMRWNGFEDRRETETEKGRNMGEQWEFRHACMYTRRDYTRDAISSFLFILHSSFSSTTNEQTNKQMNEKKNIINARSSHVTYLYIYKDEDERQG